MIKLEYMLHLTACYMLQNKLSEAMRILNNIAFMMNNKKRKLYSRIVTYITVLKDRIITNSTIRYLMINKIIKRIIL